MRRLRRPPTVTGMSAADRAQDPWTTSVTDDTGDGGPALRDASAAAARIEADEREAIVMRERLRDGTLPVIPPDALIEGHIRQAELVHDLRRSAILRAPGDDRALGYGGTLFLTSQRLIHVGQVTVNVELTDIVETSLAGERLLVTLRDGEGVALDVDRPRTFRTEIAAALREVRT